MTDATAASEKGRDETIKRLRASKAAHDRDVRDVGLHQGRKWASEAAEYAELALLERAGQAVNGDWESWFVPARSDAYGAGQRFAFTVRPHVDGDRDEAANFWNEALGEDDAHLADDPAFVCGFAAGALEVYGAVSDRL